jgi:hypothetical protein
MIQCFVEASSASIGGILTTITLLPIDIVKVRMQSQSASSRKQGISQTAEAIYLNGGISSFFSGSTPAGVRSGIEKAVFYFSSNFIKVVWRHYCGPVPKWGNLLAGYFADFSHLPLTLPIERVVKTLQTSHSDKPQSVTSIIGQIMRVQGVAGFYRGIWAYPVLCLRPALQYAVFEACRAYLLQVVGYRESLTAVEAFVLGAVARAVAILIIYPFIRIKVMAQASSTKSNATEALVVAMRRVAQKDGLLGLYRGMLPELLRGMLSAALMLALKERSQVFISPFIYGAMISSVPVSCAALVSGSSC